MNDKRIVKGIWIPIEIWKDGNLSWSERILLMEIDSFTSKDKDCFFSDQYISEMLGVYKTTANKIMASLINKGYVVVTRFDGRKRYVRVAQKCKADLHKSAEQTCTEVQHNNIDEYKSSSIDIEDEYNTPFDFKSSLISLGVSKDVAEAWMKVRRRRGAINSKFAFDAVAREVKKSGLSAEECIRTAVENSWRGFKAEYLESSQPFAKKPARETTFQHNMRVIREMYGDTWKDTQNDEPDEQ